MPVKPAGLCGFDTAGVRFEQVGQQTGQYK